MAFTSYSVDNDKVFRETLDRVSEEVSDLTIPLTLISKDFYKSEAAIFKLSGPGKYQDLAPSTKKRKQKEVGFVYPILKRSGVLADSMTDPTNSNAINFIANKNTLVIGTRVPWGVYHQSDEARSKIPLRKFLFIGPEASQFATSEQQGRLERWVGILNGFLAQKLQQLGKVQS
jgi:phage gpG-like protein